ncbi:hypothetical protein Cpir12675_004227 [Ceratocystis pirilliformis]|uniref:N-acetyltransferase domain-containing protein n=1 Tax=Ceratocystis pirilliformis TaxID=259994 RepID=A0ABR3YY91_9PEZI
MPIGDVNTTLPKRPYQTPINRPIIKTDRLILKASTAEHEAHIHALRTQEEVMQWSAAGHVDADLVATRRSMAAWLAPHDIETWNYVVFRRDTGAFVGTAGNYCRAGTQGWPELGYMLMKKHWGMGYATEVLRAFLQVWWELPREKVEVEVDSETCVVGTQVGYAMAGEAVVDEVLVAEVDILNKKSVKLLRKFGFEVAKRWQDSGNGKVVFDNSSALRYSAYLGSLEGIKHGLARGLHPSPSVWGGAGWYGCRSLRALTAYQDDIPALYWAAWWGDVEMVEALLQANADVNQIVTARRIAAATDDLLLCESLLAVLNEDAKLFGYNQSNDDMASALYLALDAGYEPITHLLICDAKCKLVLNKTTMLHAIHKASRDCLINVMGTILCQSEKEAFARDISGHTALHHAMARPQNKTVEVIQALLKFKVKVNAKNNVGLTALDFGFAKMQEKCGRKSRTAFSRALHMWVKATLALVDEGGEFSVYSKEQVRNILPRGQWANYIIIELQKETETGNGG